MRRRTAHHDIGQGSADVAARNTQGHQWNGARTDNARVLEQSFSPAWLTLLSPSGCERTPNTTGCSPGQEDNGPALASASTWMRYCEISGEGGWRERGTSITCLFEAELS